jgi:hypothetical protein
MVKYKAVMRSLQKSNNCLIYGSSQRSQRIHDEHEVSLCIP